MGYSAPHGAGPGPPGVVRGRGTQPGLACVRLGPCSLRPGSAVSLSDQSHKQGSVKAALGWGSPRSPWGLGSAPSSPPWFPAVAAPVSGSVWEGPPPPLARGAAAHPFHGLLPRAAGGEAGGAPGGRREPLSAPSRPALRLPHRQWGWEGRGGRLVRAGQGGGGGTPPRGVRAQAQGLGTPAPEITPALPRSGQWGAPEGARAGLCHAPRGNAGPCWVRGSCSEGRRRGETCPGRARAAGVGDDFLQEAGLHCGQQRGQDHPSV